jgi:uncharacterized small protein (DUF1192 family)
MRADEENASLRLQIEEWQKRYSALELQLADYKGYENRIALLGNEIERLQNAVRVKIEENEALKVTISRLEL